MPSILPVQADDGFVASIHDVGMAGAKVDWMDAFLIVLQCDHAESPIASRVLCIYIVRTDFEVGGLLVRVHRIGRCHYLCLTAVTFPGRRKGRIPAVYSTSRQDNVKCQETPGLASRSNKVVAPHQRIQRPKIGN